MALVEELSLQLGRLATRRGRVVAGLWGEAGVGKTWALREARRRVPIRSAEVPAAGAPAGVLAALPRPARLPAWLPRALELAAQGELDTAPAADAVAALLGALAPFVLHVEDLHDASVDAAFWEALAARVGRSAGVGLVVTSRRPLPDVLSPRHVAPLTGPETTTLLDRELGARLPPAAAAWIHDLTHGNPLFTLEYLRFLVQQGHLYSDGQRWHWRPPHAARLPSGVEALIAHQLRATPLSGDGQRVWETLVVCPPEAWALAGPAIADVPAARWDAARDELRHAGLLRGDDLAHPLYREVAARQLGVAGRQLRAARAAEALAQRAPILAARLVPDAGVLPERATALLRRGAHAATQAGQRREAATFLTRALEVGGGRPPAGLALEAARLWSDLDPRQAGVLAQDVLHGEPGHLEATFLLAGALVAQGDEARAERLVNALDWGQGREWFVYRLTLHAEQHQYPAVLTLWQAWPQWHADAPASVLAAVGRALDFAGRPREALALLDMALDRPDVPERTALLMARCRAHYNAGHPYDAEADATAVIGQTTSEESPTLLARALSSRATIRDTLGHYALALADAERSLALFAALGMIRDHAQQQTRVACLLLEYGEYARAESLLHEGREVLRRAEPTHFLALSEMNLAYLYLEQAPPHGGALALHYAHLGVQSARAAGSPLIVAQALGTAARAEAIHGTAARALELAWEAQALTAPDSHDAAWASFALGFALEAGADVSGALAAFRHAARHLEERGLGLWAARFALEADRIAGDRAAARDRLGVFRAHDLHNWIHLTQRYFPALEATAPMVVAAPAVEVQVLGPWQVWRGSERVPFRTPLGRALLTQLIEARVEGRPGVRPLDLQQALYPHLPDVQAGAALHQLVYRCRQSLGPEAIVLGDDGYVLGAVRTDIETFLTAGDVTLWRGPYLEGGAGGAVADRLHARLRAHALELAAAGESAELARTGQLLLREDPFDHELLALTLGALATTGQARTARLLRQDVKARHTEVGEPFPEILAAPAAPRQP